MALLFLYLPTQAQTIRYVSPTASGTGDGTSWTNASADLQAVITLSNTNDQVWVAAGTYTPTSMTGPDSRTISFSMKSDVAIYGGFAGTETTLNERNTAANPTILSGEIGDPTSTTDNSYHVINNTGLSNTAILDGFTIRGGNANGSFDTNQQKGGGMLNTNSSPQLSNCFFISNTAIYGGAIYVQNNSNSSITNCAFLNNSGNSGGGLYVGSSSPTLTNCSFQGNTGPGGAIYQLGSGGPALVNSVLFGNGTSALLGSVSASYCLLEATVIGYTSVTGNLTTTLSPFVSTSSVALNPCAPAINAGSPVSQTATSGPYSSTALPTTDLLGNPRIFGNAVDMGAAEFQGVSNGFTLAILASPSNTLTCKQTSLTITAMGNNGAPFSYSFAGGNIVSQSQSANTATAVVNTPANYTVSATNAQGCTSAQISTIVSRTEIGVSNPTVTTAAVGETFSQAFTVTGNVRPPYSFSMASVDLPPGLSLSTTGILSGTPTQSGSYSLAVTASDTNGCVGTGATYVLTVPVPPPALRYVRAGATGDGTSWANASGNLQSQIDAAGVREIWVAAGTYKTTNTTDRNVSFTLKSGIAVYGGFPAMGTPTMVDRKPGSFTTILSGEIGDPTSTTDNSGRVVFGIGLSNATIFDGFVITGAYGGGLAITSSSPQIRNCVFIDNTGSFGSRGAGINSYNSSNVPCTPLIINCAFIRNTGSNAGGAIYIGSSGASNTPVIVNCSFLNNDAFSGGAIFNESYPATLAPQITNCVFFGNWSSTFFGNTTFGNGSNSALPSARYCLFEASTTGYTSVTGNITTTTSPFAGTGSVALTSCSPAINAGDPTSQTVTSGPYSASALPATDPADNPRIVGDRVDMGAYEYQGNPTIITLTSPAVVTAT